MKYLFNILLCCLIVLPGCQHYRNRSKQVLEQINTWSKDAVHTSINQNELFISPEELKNISQEKAFAIALRNNQAFLAQLEDIGIKSSDLLQAGFFSNPNIETILHFPAPANQTSFEINARFVISDFWQVPLRKKIAEDELTIKTFEIMEKIIELKKDIAISFHRCTFESMRYQLFATTVQALKSLQEHIDYRYQFGYTTDLDKYLVTIELHRQHGKLTKQKGILHAALYELQYLLGLNASELCITTQPAFRIPHLDVSHQELFQLAQRHNPMLLSQDVQIKKAQHTIRYEQSRMVDNIELGISFERDFEKNEQGVGPIFSFDLPIFDTNFGNIEHARYELDKAHHNFANSMNAIQSKISSLFVQYTTLLQALELYPKEIFPAIRKAITFTMHQMHIMQMPATMVIDTQLKYLHMGEDFIDYLEKASMVYAMLEQAVGKALVS